MKKHLSILLVILMIVSLTACKSGNNEQENTNNTSSTNSNEQQTTNIQESTVNTGTSFKLVDRSFDDLSDEEKEQLKYYNDGYTFIGNILDEENKKWYLYKYGELFKVIDIKDFVVNEKPKYEKYHLNSSNIRNYVVIGNSLYFFISEAKDVYKIDFDNLKIQKYIDGEKFKEYAVYNNSVMLKHNNNLLFICTCENWNNIIEVDTSKENPTLDYKGKSDTILVPGDDWEEFNFIPIDKDNYRITQYGYNIVSSLTSYCSYNFSLNDYKISDIRQFPDINYDEEHWQDYVDEESLGYFYRDDKDILFSYIKKENVNDISGRNEFTTSILESDSEGNKSLVCENLPYFHLSIDTTSLKTSALNWSRLSNNWVCFSATGIGKNLVYFFEEKILCDFGYYSIKNIDLWNVYYEEWVDGLSVCSCKAVTDFKSNIFQNEES